MHSDPDGLRRTPREGGGFAARVVVGAAVIVLVAVAGAFALRPRPRPGAEPAPATQAETVQPSPAEASRPQRPAAAAPRPAAPPRDPVEQAIAAALADDAPPPEDVDGGGKEIWVDQLGGGDGKGIHAFPKPGTKPLKGGLVVPDGFELPPGYVRHVQTTDDGRQLPPILMFHPDFTPTGPDGKPIAVPPDRIVPPELAPPGMPVRWQDAPPVREGR